MTDKILSYLHDEQGGTAAEYAIMVSLIALVIIAAVTVVGLATTNLFESATNEFEKF